MACTLKTVRAPYSWSTLNIHNKKTNQSCGVCAWESALLFIIEYNRLNLNYLTNHCIIKLNET
jgi:hypothetical protein